MNNSLTKIARLQLACKLILVLFTGCSVSAIAAEGKIQNKQDFQTNESEVPINVNDYLKKNAPTIKQDLEKLLNQAIKDAKDSTVDEISNNLWALSPSQPKVKSRIKDGKVEFLMATWLYADKKKASQLSSKKGNNYSFGKYVWVTAVPQVREFCHNCKGLAVNIPGYIMLPLRLQQYLGLRLENVKTHFVEMWVKEDDLFRPCIDREITDSSCNNLPKNIPETASNLDIINLTINNVGYPWTGLGYTYDWGNPQKPHIGASEFVIKKTNQSKQVEVEINSVTATEEYCKNQYLTPSNLQP